MAESIERTGLLGQKYLEHYDDHGNRIGESLERKGLIFGQRYYEHYDAQGNKTGESHERQGFFSKYFEHYDTRGVKTGTSIEREGFFSKYYEHYNSAGNKTGESTERKGLLVDRYYENTGNGGFTPATGGIRSASGPASPRRSKGESEDTSKGNGCRKSCLLTTVIFAVVVWALYMAWHSPNPL